jgi:small subunit ribosomal protein S6
MRPYEVMIILEAGLEEDAIRTVLDRSAKIITDGGGNPGRVDRWGRRRFAYELHHKWEGYYVLLEATAEPATMAQLDRMLSLADDVIRHKVIRVTGSNQPRPRKASAPAADEPVTEAG